MKILVAFTGGTIGCKIKSGFLSTDESTNYALLDNFRSDDNVEFSVITPYSVLSENISANEINILQSEIVMNLDKGYDGIIVTHGTDSLMYTAAALEYALGCCDIPVVLVSADYPLDDERSNGYKNFEAAVAFIKNKRGKGVFVSYKNNGENDVNIHIATHIRAHGECNADLYPITEKPFAVYSGETVCVNGIADENCGKGIGKVEYCDYSDILVVECRPGDSFMYNLDGVKAIILKPYHSATLNTACSRFGQFCKKASEKNVPIFLVNSKQGLTYESASLFSAMNIKTLPFSSYISAYMKIWAAISLDEDVVEFSCRRISREICE